MWENIVRRPNNIIQYYVYYICIRQKNVDYVLCVYIKRVNVKLIFENVLKYLICVFYFFFCVTCEKKDETVTVT